MRFVTGLSLVAVLLIIPHAFAANKAAIPSLAIEGDDGMVALALDAVRIDVLIRGHLARTTFELTYRNDLGHEVDGSFTFPLPVDAEVSEVGLYFDGKLRNAVAVERVQARAAYEETVHRRVDPALAEWNGSTRSFRFRVYPIPPHGTKVVHIAYDEELTARPYELDLRYAMDLSAFDVTIDSEVPVDSNGMVLRRAGNVWSAAGRKAKLDGTIRAVRDARETALVFWSATDGMWYASAPVHVRSSSRKVEPVSQVTLLVDTSSSAVERDAAKLQAFLSALVARQKPLAPVRVIPFHIAVDAAIETSAVALERTLADLPLAGATNLMALLERLPAIAASAPPDARLVLVTDGVETLGDARRLARAIESLKKLRRPLMVVNASPTAEDHVLTGLARATGGWYIDLSNLDADRAVDAAMREPVRADMKGAGPTLVDVLPDALLVTSDLDVAVSARSRDRILAFDVFAGEDRYNLPVRQVDAGRNGDLVIRAWARTQLRSLLARGASAAEVREHGLRFNQLTPQTSLLVLDTWQDYENYGIPVPPELREQRERDLAEAEKARAASMSTGTIAARVTTSEASASNATWFMKGKVTTGGDALPGVWISMSEIGYPKIETVSNVEGLFWLTASRVPGPFTVRAELAGLQTVDRPFPRGTPKGTLIEIDMPVSSVSEAITVTAAAPTVSEGSEVQASMASLVHPTSSALADQLLSALVTNTAPVSDDDLESAPLALRLDRIEAVVAKLRSLRSTEDRFRYYIAARSVVGGEKLFQAEAALAMRDDSPELAVRALTDLAEAYPTDAPTLRLLGRVLDGWGRADLARLLFERALDLAPLETQTWRELMLLAAKERREDDLAQLQRRFDTESRDDRMDQTETAILGELQRRRPGTDPRIDSTAELQVEAMWDSNYTDVDLHVVEPGGEEVFYSHPKSAKGGLLHDDVQTGFGPETYTLPKLDHGTYQIVLTYYAGDITRFSLQTLAHVIVYVNGERKDFFSALTAKSEREVVATVTW
jgi:Ca-activated chloride channel homolog